MAHRTQITLRDEQYVRLRRESERTGASLSELVRRALDDKYGGELTLEEKLRILEQTAGALGPDYGRRYDEHRRLQDERNRERLRDG